MVARKPTTHGILARVATVAGESPQEWDSFRGAVVASLAPVGVLELALAERAALQLWRLRRLARHEAETITAAVEDAGLPPAEAGACAELFLPPMSSGARSNSRWFSATPAERRVRGDPGKRTARPDPAATPNA